MILGVLGIIFMIMLSQESKHAQRNRGQIIHETFNGAPFVTYKVSKIGGGTLTMQQVLEAAMNLGYELHAQSDSEHIRSEEHTSELQSRFDLVCRLLLET